ncbi:MAG: alpha/beta hydrolase, partial [Chloroflexota bacterium]
MPQPLIELINNSDKPTLAISPANGFVPQVYLPMLSPLANDYRIVSVPPRALWKDGAPPENYADYSWLNVAEDMIMAYEKFDLKDVVAVGHSIGAVTTLLATLQRPDLFKAIILLDPVILPKMATDWMREQIKQGNIINQPMIEGALRRRNKFKSIDDAFDNYHGKSIFADWSDEVLRLYVTHGTVECDDGLRCLAWSPQWEAFYFGTYYVDIWTAIHRFTTIEVPTLIVNGGDSDTFQPQTVTDVKGILRKADFDTVEGHGHLFPQSAPQATADVIQAW